MSDKKDDEYLDTQVTWLVFGLLGALTFGAFTVMDLRAGNVDVATYSRGAIALMALGYSVRAIWRLLKGSSRHEDSDGAE